MSDEYYDSEPDNRSRRGNHRDRPVADRRVSWGAIFAGAIIALAFWTVFTLLGAGIGLGIVKPINPDSAANIGVGIGGAVWFLVSAIISLLFGGYAAARLAGVTRVMDGILQGITMWAVTTLVLMYLLTNAIGGVLGGAYNMAGGLASTAQQSISSALPQVSGVSPNTLKSKVGGLLDNKPPPPPQQMNRQQAISAITDNLPDLMGSGPKAKQAHQRIVTIISSHSGISQQQASQKLDKWQQEATSTTQDVKQTAKSTAKSATDIAGSVAFWASIMLIIGIFSAAIGGAIGKRSARR